MISVTIEGMDGVDQSLAMLPLEVRRSVLTEGMRDASKAVVRRAKELVPKPGYPGDKPGLPSLMSTLTYVVKEYDTAIVAVIGPRRPKGRHGHLVEHGHDIVTRGTKEHASGRASGMTAAGRRWVEAQGFYYVGGSYWKKQGEQGKYRIANKLRGINKRGTSVTLTVRGLGIVKGRVPANPFLEPASIDTRNAQQQAITNSIAKAITKALGVS